MELPFDIIKFDRSLVVEAEKNKNADFMVRNFSNLFTDLKYSILFEGVETDDQEKLCVEMGANYIQGYKHSKPIPIERLSGFLEKM
jgi:EAL domain-containing protein (putative c-di-GMP-specific phosphodiesterase class I)